MFQIDNDTSSLNLPAPTAANRPGYFVDGDPAKGLAATILPAEFMNMLMMEFVNLVKAAGLAPSKSDYTQLSQAIPALISKLATVDWSKVTNIPVDLVHLNTIPTLSAIELNSAVPCIDFHYGSDAGDYNIRLVNGADQTLSVISKSGLTLLSVSASGAVFGKALEVSGATTLDGALEVKGSAVLDGTLEVKGAATLDSSLEVKGTATMDSSLEVKGGTTLDGNLHTKGFTSFDSNVTIAGQVAMGYGASIAGTLEIGGQSGVANTPFIDFHSGATVVDFDSRIIASGGTGVAGGGQLLFQAAATNLSGSLQATTAIQAGTNVYAGGGTSIFQADGNIGGSIWVGGNLFAHIANQISYLGLLGQVAFFASSTAPTGWLKANGAAVSRTAYATLFSVIGTTYGVGDGSTTFNLPDMRGYFPRGYDDSRGVDSGRVLGSAQAGQDNSLVSVVVKQGAADVVNGTISIPRTGALSLYTETGASTGTVICTAFQNSALEVRPMNIALLACIKY
jgi:microcystin-dependent protein/cytoskeletal protein CcmA (bactofilin family)